ncbi:hypothetical protein PTKU46_01040 [Paraburkholderia terrae]|uniref:Uncharacterized protein n=1 Tax=Paraburkholderia terrae TaxID=311230 RepID=A0ABM7TE93_9BURK|nr:hypothetical protein PTKU64_01000 [Paraburkholderia terrae]BDC36806.1 hypothetical protein PTKU15_01030 [Paraburkholderia terrae]
MTGESRSSGNGPTPVANGQDPKGDTRRVDRAQTQRRTPQQYTHAAPQLAVPAKPDDSRAGA